MYEWLGKNHEWVFSGIGVAFLSLILQRLYSAIRRERVPSDSSQNAPSSSNNQEQNQEVNVSIALPVIAVASDAIATAKVHFERAKDHLSHHRSEIALEELNRSIMLHATAEAFYLRAEIKAVKRKYTECLPDLEDTIRLDPGNAAARYALARVKGILGRHEEAVRALKQYLQLDRYCAPALRARGELLLKLNRERSARANIEAAEMVDGSWVDRYAGVGWGILLVGLGCFGCTYYIESFAIAILGLLFAAYGLILEFRRFRPTSGSDWWFDPKSEPFAYDRPTFTNYLPPRPWTSKSSAVYNAIFHAD